MKHSRYFFAVLTAVVIWFVPSPMYAEDEYVKKAMSLTARDFDKDLPDQPINEWLRSHIPPEYRMLWGEHTTDCGEATGTTLDTGRDMPMCVEVEFIEGRETRGCLDLFVGTKERGFSKNEHRLYFGHLEYGASRYNFRRLSDMLKVK
jgi:hypothetical protein